MYFIKKYRRGIKNEYRRKMPVLEMTIKDMLFQSKETINYLKNNFTHKTIVAHPHFPSKKTTIYKICNTLNYNITNKLNRKYDLAVYFENSTYRNEFQNLEKLEGKKVINLFSRNIGKEFIDEIHERVLGYCTKLNPLTYNGKAVKKNLLNAKHDGKIVHCPVNSIEEGYIYQKFINNEVDVNIVRDIRVPIINYKIPFVYFKNKKISDRFTNETIKTTLEKAESIFEPVDINNIISFCKELKLDFGELDVLRDKNDNKIYIVDVNNTPYGPPASISKKDEKQAISLLADLFRKEFLSL
ncbi:MAG: hypothetical protein ABII90_15570 [Bacteroidota bacterium]